MDKAKILIAAASVSIAAGITYAIPDGYHLPVLCGMAGTAFVITRRPIQERIENYLERKYEETMPNRENRPGSSDLSDEL